MIKLDFEHLPLLDDKRPLLCQLGDHRTITLQKFNNVFERAHCALYFIAKFHSESNGIIKKALLRASIAEFVSIEEVVKVDLKINSISANPLLIRKTENPLLHIIKQLRNYNIHLGSTILDYTDETTRIFGTKEDLANGTGYKYSDKEVIITNLNISEFNKLKDANKYCDKDKLCIIDWFNLNQIRWGVGHLIYLAILDYCDRIISFYELTKK